MDIAQTEAYFQKIFDAGRYAKRSARGYIQSTNPYPQNTTEHRIWKTGVRFERGDYEKIPESHFSFAA